VQDNKGDGMCSKHCRRAVVSVTAMIYLILISALAMAMASMTGLNTKTAYNHDAIERARISAETGLRWLSWRLQRIEMPTTSQGSLTATLAGDLWSKGGKSIMMMMQKDVQDLSPKASCTSKGSVLEIGPVALADGSTFTLTAIPGNLWTPSLPAPANDARVIVVKSVGSYRGSNRAMVMQFLIQKTLKYAVLSKIPIQLGKNTVLEGDVFMAAAPRSGQPPILSISDFRYTSATTSDALTKQVQKFQDYLQRNYAGHDNRIALSGDATTAAAQLAAIRGSDSSLATASDYNSDGFIDEYDLFLGYFDSGNDHRVQGAPPGQSISGTEFGSKAPKDSNLFYLLDQSVAKPFLGDDVPRLGYEDGYLDKLDPYAKVNGHVKIWETESQLSARLASDSTLQQVTPTIGSALQGAMVSSDGAPVVQFGCNDATDPATLLSPDSFNMSAFLDLAGSAAGTAVRPKTTPAPDTTAQYSNTIVSAHIDASSYAVSGDANGTTSSTTIKRLTDGGSTLKYSTRTVGGTSQQVVTAVVENVPYGSSSPRSTCVRPVFSNMAFKNCIIDRGTNALFVNCTFDGVTFVDGAYDMQKSTGDYAKGNSLRFDGCTFTGPIAQGDASAGGVHKAAAPSGYTDYTNSWEFSGATTFDLNRPSRDGSTDSDALAAIKQQATIMAPQTNIEMGSFTAPGQASCSFQGVVVAGCFDVRGNADIDGTIIVPTGAAGNVTLGYFGSNDNATSQGEPDPSLSTVGAAYGGIHIRYNPYRSLPDGITLPVAMLPDPSTMHEEDP